MKNWIQAARVFVIGASALPAVYGALLAYYEQGKFNPWLFVLTLLGVALLHFAANLFNDYFDFKSGADTENKEAVFPFSGGSRVILEGKITPQAVKRAATWCTIVASAIGIGLAFTSGIWVLVLGVFGVLTSVLYVHPRFSLINLGIGELVVGLDFGVLTVCGAYYVQTGNFTPSALMCSLPIALIIALILVANEFPDYNGDKAVGKRTLVVRLGRRNASYLITALLVLMVLIVALNAALGFGGLMSLTALLVLPMVYQAIRVTLRHYDEIPQMIPANVLIINSHMFLNIYLAASCLFIGGFKPLSLVLIVAALVWQAVTMQKLQFFSRKKAS